MVEMIFVKGVNNKKPKSFSVLLSMFDDSNISLKAKGFISYCMSSGSTSDFYFHHMQRVLKEGEDSLNELIQECLDNGYAYQQTCTLPDGTVLKGQIFISDSKEEILEVKREMEKAEAVKKGPTKNLAKIL